MPTNNGNFAATETLMEIYDPDNYDDPLDDDSPDEESIESFDTSLAGELEWRDTYFILFRYDQRPTLTQVEAALTDTTRGVRLENLEADDDGLFQSILIQAPEDNAALEVSFESGEAVVEQSMQLAEQLRSDEDFDAELLKELLAADARLDVMHFERVSHDPYAGEDEMPDMLDPASLLSVVQALAKLTGGMAIDPGSGSIME